MRYYHVLISDPEDPESFRCLLSDLDERSVRARFVRLFQRSENLFIDGRVHRASEIAGVQIRMTYHPADYELKRIQKESWEAIERMNRDSNVVFISPGRGYSRDDLSLAGEDVTSFFLSTAPVAFFTNWLHNPWVITLVGGLIVALLVALVFG